MSVLGVWLTRATNIGFLVNPLVLGGLYYYGKRSPSEFSIHDVAYVFAHVTLFCASVTNHVCTFGDEPVPDGAVCPVTIEQAFWADAVAAVVLMHVCMMQRASRRTLDWYLVSTLVVVPVLSIHMLYSFSGGTGFLIFCIMLGVLDISFRYWVSDLILHKDRRYAVLLVALIVIFTGTGTTLQYLIQTDAPYYATHSVWHVCMCTAGLLSLFLFERRQSGESALAVNNQIVHNYTLLFVQLDKFT